MKVYCTKYYLTKGVMEVEGEPSDSSPDVFIIAPKPGTYSWAIGGENKDWHRTEEGAMRRATVMLVKQRKSLLKKLSDLNGLENELRIRMEAFLKNNP